MQRSTFIVSLPMLAVLALAGCATHDMSMTSTTRDLDAHAQSIRQTESAHATAMASASVTSAQQSAPL